MDEGSTCSPLRTVGRYVIEEALGSGGMGAVYRALDPLLSRHVALKLLHPDPSHDETTRAEWSARMLREARAAAAFNHPNVVAVYDVGTDEGAPFIAMELVSGKTLRKFVGDEAIALRQRARWLSDIARALGAAHRAGIVHRDVKPENVLVTDDRTIKILDFGIAKRSNEASPSQTLQTLTAQGMILGTPQYMAPEQIRGESLDGRADQFAWGVVAFELLTGRSLWPRSTQPMRLIASILTSVAPPAQSVAPTVPTSVSAVVERALSKRAVDRFPDMDAAADALDAAFGEPTGALAAQVPAGLALAADSHAHAHHPQTAMPREGQGRRRQVVVVAVAALTIGALGTVATLAYLASARGHARASAAKSDLSVSSTATRRIAVLPFDNLTGRPEDNWLRIGLSDALQAKLASVEGFEVVALPAGGTSDAALAKSHGAKWVVVGSFQKVGAEIRIAARVEAIDGPPGEERRQLASTEQRGSMAQIFDLQDAVALALVERLDTGTPATVQSAIRRSGTRNLEAFEAFTTGRTLLVSGHVPEAMRAFDRAVSADPGYRDARATLNRVRAESHHFLVKSDGTVVETISEALKGDPDHPWELTTDSGTLTRAWDLDGRALTVERVAASGNQATFRVVFEQKARPVSPEGGPSRGIVYEIESSSKDKRHDGLSVLFHAVAKSTSGETTFIVQLPRGAKALSVVPTPIDSRQDDGGTFLVLREARGAFVPYAWSVVHASDASVVTRFMSQKPAERAEWIKSADPRMTHHKWALDLSRAADAWQTCLLAQRGDVAGAKEFLGRMQASSDQYGAFLVQRGAFCIASALNDDRAAADALEAAIVATDRPVQLIPEAHLDAIAWCFDRKRVGDMSRLVRLELREAPWYIDKPFHNRLPAVEEKALRQLLTREPGNVAAEYDLALFYYQSKRYDEAREALKGADEFLGGVYIADLRARIAVARGVLEEAAAELRKLVTYYPLTWAWTAHAVLLASGGRADEAFAVVAQQAPKTEYEPPVFWALRYVVGVLPHASRYDERIVEIVKKAKETQYGQPYRLDRMVDLIEVSSLSLDPEGVDLAHSLFDKLKTMLRDTSPEACDAACLRRLGSHLCRVRGLTGGQRAWVFGTMGEHCE